MKRLHLYIYLGACVLPIACMKQLDINQNPNFPSTTQGTAAVVFPIGMLGTIGYVGGAGEIVGGIWAQYFTQSAYANQYTDIDSYSMPNRDPYVVAIWDNLYASGLENFQYTISAADSAHDWMYYLMGTVMNAYTAEVLVDLYGAIPYSQAFQGGTNLSPKFDSGFAVYQALIAGIETAKGKDFTVTTNSTPSAAQDPVFAGDQPSWIAFANTLELKMYLRMVNAQPALAQTGVTGLINGGATFLTTSASFTTFSDNPGLENPFYDENIQAQNTNSNLRASTTFVSWLEANNDSRIVSFFGSTAPETVNQGDFHGADTAYANAAIFVQSPTDPVDFISEAESYFLQAEAAVRYYGGAGAQALYEQGVTAAFAEVGQDASTYIAPGGVYAWGNEKEGGKTLTPIQQIIRQKWVSCAAGCHGIEAFFEQNRTGIPAQSPVYSTASNYIPGQLVVVKNSVLPAGLMPKRMVYPYDETSRNQNAPPTVAQQIPVWWGL
jgi:hypothetical protein